MRGKRTNLLDYPPFGSLTVITFDGKDKNRNAYWKCLCVCGVKVSVSATNLLSGMTRSCGCLLKAFNRANKGGRGEIPPELEALRAPIGKRRVVRSRETPGGSCRS